MSVNSLTFKAKSNHITGLLYGLMAGYGHTLKELYFGAEIGIQSDTTSKSKNYKYDVEGNDFSSKVKYHRGPVLSIAPRFGVVFGGSYMAYIKPALEISKDKAIASNDDGTESSKKKLQYVFAPGIGLEKAFSNVLLRMEYTYNLGSKTKIAINSDGVNGSVSLKYTSHAVKVGVAYQF